MIYKVSHKLLHYAVLIPVGSLVPLRFLHLESVEINSRRGVLLWVQDETNRACGEVPSYVFLFFADMLKVMVLNLVGEQASIWHVRQA